MKIKDLHRWDVDKEKADIIQDELKNKVIIKPISEKDIKIICGIDSDYKGNEICTVGVLCKFPELEIIETIKIKGNTKFQYIPGYLAFREGKNIIKLVKKIEKEVDCFILDGHGIAHPKRFGLASHIGVLIEKPTIGCAKKLLYGKYSEPPIFPLSSTFIKDQEGEIIGHALRNYNGSILFISPGHLIDLKGSLDIIIACIKKDYSLPYPLYLAHKNSKILD